MEGLLRFKGALRFEGHFKGEINTPDTLIIGESGKMDGKIATGSLFNMGEVQGNVFASKKISILIGSRLTGNIDTPSLISEEGALFIGQCIMPEKLPDGFLEEKESHLKRAINRTFQNFFPAADNGQNDETAGVFARLALQKKKIALGGAGVGALILLSYAAYFVISSRNYMGSTVLSRYIYERSAQNNPEKLLALGDTYFNEKYYGRAAKTYQRLLEISPPDTAVIRRTAFALEKAGRPQDAAPYFEDVLKAEPKDKEVVEKLNAWYKLSGNGEKLIAMQEFMVENRPDNVDGAKDLFKIYLDGKKFDKALTLFRDKIASSPRTVEDLIMIGKLQKNLGLLGDAIKTQTEAVNKSASSKETIIELAYTYHKAGQEDKALEIFSKINKIDPKHPEAIINTGFLNLAQGRTEKAMDLFNAALALDNGNLRASLGLAIAFSRMGDSEKAEKYCKDILTADPDYSPALNRLAWLYAQQKRNLDDAEKYSIASMRYNDSLPDYMDTLSEIYSQKQDYDKAIALITRAIKLRPSNPYYKSQLEKFNAAKKRNG